MLQQGALQLERADLVVGGLEDVVGAPDVGEVPVGVAGGDVAGPVQPVRHGLGGARRVVPVAGHHPGRPYTQVHAQLTLVGGLLAGDRVQQDDLVARRRPAHGAGLDGDAGEVADLEGGLGLAEAVANGDAPGLADLLDDLGIERLAGGDGLARGPGQPGEVGLDQHPPHGGRCAEGGHAVPVHLGHQAFGVEAGVVVDEDGRAGVPGGEEVGPGVLGPAGRRDVEVHVAGAQSQPVHGGEVPDGVRGVGVLDELGAVGGAGGEVEHQGVGGEGLPVGGEAAPGVRSGGVGGVDSRERQPAGGYPVLLPGGDPGVVAGHLVELGGVLGAGHDVAYVAALDPVAQVGRAEEGRGGDDDGAQLHRAEHHLPQLALVAEHDEDPVAGRDAPGAQPVRGRVGPRGELCEGEGLAGAVLLDDAQGVGVVAGGDVVEPVEGPVEAVGAGPGESGVGGCVLAASLQQEVPRGKELGGGAVPGTFGRHGRYRAASGARTTRAASAVS